MSEILCLRQAWLSDQVCEARNQWCIQFEERWLENDDVPDLDYFIGLWIAERYDDLAALRILAAGDEGVDRAN